MDSGIEASVCTSPQASLTSAGVPKGVDETFHFHTWAAEAFWRATTVQGAIYVSINTLKQSSSPELPEAVCVPLKLPAPRIIPPTSYGPCMHPPHVWLGSLGLEWICLDIPFPLFSQNYFLSENAPQSTYSRIARTYIRLVS